MLRDIGGTDCSYSFCFTHHLSSEVCAPPHDTFRASTSSNTWLQMLPIPFLVHCGRSLFRPVFLARCRHAFKGVMWYFRNPLVCINCAILLVAQDCLDISFWAFCVQSSSRDHQGLFLSLQIILRFFRGLMRFRRIACSMRLWSSPLLRRCACSVLKALTEPDPPSNSVPQCAQKSLVYPQNDWHQVQVPTSVVHRSTSQPLASVHTLPSCRVLKVARSPRV